MKEIILKMYRFITSLWRDGKKFIDNHLGTVIEITERIKKIVDSPQVGLVTQIIPGEWDDNLLAGIRKALPLALEATGILVECRDEDDPRDYFECIVEEFRKIKPEQRAGVLRDFASNLARFKASESKDPVPATRQINLLLEMEYNRIK